MVLLLRCVPRPSERACLLGLTGSLPQLVLAAKSGVSSSRKAISGLFAVLVESVEAEFEGVLCGADTPSDGRGAEAPFAIEGYGDIMQDMIRVFRLYDTVSAAMCRSVFVASMRLVAVWSQMMSRAGTAGMEYLVPTSTSGLIRSCAIDALVAIVILAKVLIGCAFLAGGSELLPALSL